MTTGSSPVSSIFFENCRFDRSNLLVWPGISPSKSLGVFDEGPGPEKPVVKSAPEPAPFSVFDD
jgi:hypothetical protein